MPVMTMSTVDLDNNRIGGNEAFAIAEDFLRMFLFCFTKQWYDNLYFTQQK